MKAHVASMGTVVKALTGFVFAMAIGSLIAAVFIKQLIILSIALFLIIAWVYLCWTPVAYELDGKRLTIFYRLGSKTFEPVEISPNQDVPWLPLKLWANGGLFGLAGTFWSPKHGVFYVYATTTARDALTRLSHGGRDIYVSPARPLNSSTPDLD